MGHGFQMAVKGMEAESVKWVEIIVLSTGGLLGML